MPELVEKKEPQDRSFFFNVLNTLKDGIVDKMVFNAEKERQYKSKIDDEITVVPELRCMFTDPLSLIGSKGRTILEFRKKHKAKKRVFKKRKKYELKFD